MLCLFNHTSVHLSSELCANRSSIDLTAVHLLILPENLLSEGVESFQVLSPDKNPRAISKDMFRDVFMRIKYQFYQFYSTKGCILTSSQCEKVKTHMHIKSDVFLYCLEKEVNEKMMVLSAKPCFFLT